MTGRKSESLRPHAQMAARTGAKRQHIETREFMAASEGCTRRLLTLTRELRERSQEILARAHDAGGREGMRRIAAS
jgi:hypothetical protein